MEVGSFCGKGRELCEQLRKREVDMCCLHEVRWRGQGARFVGCRGRRYKLWWFGNNDGIGGVGNLVKEKLRKVRRKRDRVIAMMLAFEEEVIRVGCVHALQVKRLECEKDQFYNDMASEWSLQNPVEVVLGLGNFNGHVGRRIDGFERVHGGYGIGKKMLEGEDYSSFVMKRSSAWPIHGLKRNREK